MGSVSEPHTAAVGEFRYEVGRADITSIWYDQTEILRRIFVTVRDDRWQEVPPLTWNGTVQSDPRHATALSARHKSDSVDFEWHGSFEIHPYERVLRFSFEGRALRDMSICRLGLVVLHPVNAMIGAHLTTDGPEGRNERVVGTSIDPQPVARGVPLAMTPPFARLAVTRPRWGVIKFWFQGDLFEMEDQRNWGDASFKTYCTPLREGFPRPVAAGTVIRHAVDIEWTPSAQPRFPQLGQLVDDAAGSGNSTSPHRSWSYVSLDLDSGDPENLRSAIERHSDDMAIELSSTADATFDHAMTAVEQLNVEPLHISRLVLRGAGASLPAASAVTRARQTWQRAFGHPPPILAATRGYFVEFNRGIPLDLAADGIAFPVSATVHADDVRTISENVATVEDMVSTARILSGCRSVCVSPLALYHPPSSNAIRFSNSLVALWLVGTLTHAARANVDAVTLAPDVVNRLTSSTSGSALLDRLLGLAGREVTGAMMVDLIEEGQSWPSMPLQETGDWRG